MNRADAHFVESMPLAGGTATVGNYPTLQVADGTFAAQQADPELSHTLAVADVTDLQNMNNNKAGNYYLSGDIDASETSSWNDGAGFVPIGSSASKFTGTFDGCGYTISGLVINRGTTADVGLFGYIRNAKIANVTLANCSVKGSGTGLGSLVGTANNTTDMSLIQNCHTSGTVTIGGTGVSTGTGGLVGQASGGDSDLEVRCYDCTTSCTVDGATSYTGSSLSEVGGFVGSADEYSWFTNCRATGDVTTSLTEGVRIGGFAGYDDGGGLDTNKFIDCSATGNVQGEDYVAGFIGRAAAVTVLRCSAHGDVTTDTGTAGGFAGWVSGTAYSSYTDFYSWGSVTSNGVDAGGLIAYVSSATAFTNAYSIGILTVGGETTYGGLLAEDPDSTITACFWDMQASGIATSDGGVGHITTWMKTQANYEAAGWDFDTGWEMDTTEGDSSKYRIEGTTVYGFNHLIGETVSLLVDGVVMPNQIVSDDGTITLPQAPSANISIHVGLKYESKLKPMKPVSQPDMMKRVVTCKQMGLSVHNTDDIKYGVHDDDMKDINFEYEQWKNKCEIDGLFTGTLDVQVPDGFSVNCPLQITTNAPLPATVRAMIPKVDMTGT